MTQVLYADAAIEDLILKALGDSTKSNKGPSEQQIIKARKALYKVLGISYSRRSQGLTQLEADIFGKCVELAEDYDVDIRTWLMEGTPMGIKAQMTPRGVFPEIDESTPLDQRRPLDTFHADFTNYKSLEEEPEGTKALLDLVASGFVKEFRSYADVLAFLDGEVPVTSKLAVVRNESDGVVKYRLILDCRVSGSNDAADRHERILLPKAWDIVREVMALKKICKDGEQVALFVLDY